MRRPGILFFLLAFSLCLAAHAVEPSFFDQLQAALQAKDREAYLKLISSDPALQMLEREFLDEYIAFQPVRTVMNLARSDDNTLRVQVLMQAAEEARFELWKIVTGTEGSKTVVLNRDVLSSVDGLYRLRMSSSAYPVRNLDFKNHDAIVHMESGQLFTITAGGALAGVLFMGRGSFVFSPPDPTEQQQLELFCKKQQLETSIQSFYVRASAEMLRRYFGGPLSQQPAPSPDLYPEAAAITRESDRSAFGVRLPFSDEVWFPRIQTSDVYSEVQSDVGTLVYQFAPTELEDIMLANKDRDRIISLYSSQGRDARVMESEDFRVLSYKMNLAFNPGNMYLSGTSEVLLSALFPSTSIVFKLNPSLHVTSITSNQGELLFYQEKTTNNLHVVLNQMVDEGVETLLRLRYEGKISPDRGRSETQISGGGGASQTDFFLPPSFLYSNQALWYPQLISKPYSRVETTVQVPSGYAAIANGQLISQEQRGGDSVYSYASDLPVKYFSLLVGRLRGTLTKESVVPIRAFFYDIDKSNASVQAEKADRILRFYSNYFGRYPYRSLSLALRPATEPGGHAPAGIVIANRVYSYMKLRFERDPLWIPEYPDFLLAHEIAHQWWGQAVGWRNYRDQWLSEGFAQFAAAEYIRSMYGDKAWLKISDEFMEWINEKTSAGPVILGTRLGHLSNDPRAFSALLYNKGAYILVMLKNWMGPENFTKCLAEFYSLYEFKRASIQDFEEVAQRYSTDDLSVFFDQWLYGWTVPEVTWAWTPSGTPDSPAVKLHFRQPPDRFYHLKIAVEVQDSGGEVFRIQALVNQPNTDVEFQLPFAPTRVIVDPLRENLMNLIPLK